MSTGNRHIVANTYDEQMVLEGQYRSYGEYRDSSNKCIPFSPMLIKFYKSNSEKE